MHSGKQLTTLHTFQIHFFRQADKNGDGRLSLDEIITIFKVNQILIILLINRKWCEVCFNILLIQANNATISEDDLRATFSQCDTDQSGDLDLEEYGRFCKKADLDLDPVPTSKERVQAKDKKYNISETLSSFLTVN